MLERALSVALLIVSGVALSPGKPKDRFMEYFEELEKGGPPFRNCGHIETGRSRAEADSCVLQALEAKQPFFVLYEKQGIDSRVAEGLVLSRSKQLTVVEFDDYSCGSPHCEHVYPCDSPKISKTKDGLHIQCVNAYDM